MKFEKIVNIKPPYDKRNDDPKKNYGIGDMSIWFILKKGEKAVQVMLSTGRYLRTVEKEWNMKGFIREGDYEGFSCWDVGYHSNTPQYSGQDSMECSILKKGKCYYDGSSLRGKDDKIAENFVKHGTDWIWKYLEKDWEMRFGK